MLKNSLEVLLKYRFWLSRFRMGTEIYIANKFPGDGILFLHIVQSEKNYF